jgi:hypothetical protein
MSAGLAQQVATSSQTGTWERRRGSGPIPKQLFQPVLLNPARRVDPGPGGWIGPGLLKDRLGQQPGQTRATRRVDT